MPKPKPYIVRDNKESPRVARHIGSYSVYRGNVKNLLGHTNDMADVMGIIRRDRRQNPTKKQRSIVLVQPDSIKVIG